MVKEPVEYDGSGEKQGVEKISARLGCLLIVLFG